MSLASSASLSASLRSVSRSVLVLTSSSSSVARSWSLMPLSRASSAKMRRGLLAELDLEPVDDVVLLAELRELAGALVLQLLDAHFEPPRRHGELGAQLILVGLDFRHRQRCRGFEPAHGQAHRAPVHERHDDESEQARGQKAEPEEHDRFDHEERLRPRPREASSAHCHAARSQLQRGHRLT